MQTEQQIGDVALASTNIIPPTLDSAPEVPDAAKAANNGGVWPKFYHRPVLNKSESEKKGRPVHDQVEWVDIIVAGDKNSRMSCAIRQQDKDRWPVEYAAFKNGSKIPLQGTPLEQWPQLGVDQVADLKSLGIMTVEMLAELSDEQVQNYGMGGHQMREKAQAYIQTALDQAAPQHLASENARQAEQLKEQAAVIDEMKKSIKDLQESGGSNPEEVESLKQQLEQNNMLIDTQKLALEGLQKKVDDLTEENEKLKKKPTRRKTAEKKE